jgi:neurotransmitter:Na+ symporter, NSS family
MVTPGSMANHDDTTQTDDEVRSSNPVVIGRVTRAALRPRPVWSSGSAYLISAIAGVVGLGAIWRFPYLVGEHGGGSFIIAYLVCMTAIALPLAVLESAAGQSTEQSPVGLFRRLGGRPGAVFGWMPIVVIVVLMSYYFVVSGWTMGYAGDAIIGRVRPFDEFTGGYISLWLLLGLGVAVYLVLLRGVAALERASRYLVMLLALAVFSLATYALTLDGAGEALRFLTTIELDHLSDAATWRAAAGQAFYQMGIGQGFLIAYGSYSPTGLKLVRGTGLIALANATIALTAAGMVFPIVFTYDIDPQAGAQLAFSAFPVVLAELPAGALVAVVFFGLLFIAAFTSCLGGAAVAIAAVRDEFRMAAQPAALLVVAVIVVAGIPSAMSYTPLDWTLGNRPFLDAIDRLTGSGIVIVVGLLGSALIAWRMPTRSLALAMRFRRRRIGPIQIDSRLFIRYGRFLPLVAIGGLIVSLLM